MKIAITGADGFIGAALSKCAASRKLLVCGITRVPKNLQNGIHNFAVGDIDGTTDWGRALSGCEVVIHLAGRVHKRLDLTANPVTEFRRINVDATLNLAHQASLIGVKRFIYISSIKVNGELTEPGSCFTAEDTPQPLDPYGVSKMEAEVGLRDLANKTGMEVVIVRPPLVYGPGVRANFSTMMHCLKIGMPLPFGAIDNRRSFVALDNLVDLLLICITHPAAANQTFLVSDGEDVSTSQLLRKLGGALGRPVFLFSVPITVIKVVASVICMSHLVGRLCDSLLVDIEKTRRLLGWTPPISLDEGLKKAAKGMRL